VEGGGLEVVRVLAAQPLHGGGVGAVALGLLAGAVEQPDRVEPGLLPRGDAGRGGRDPGQDLPCGVGLLQIAPDRMVVGHRLSPGGHREAWLDPAGGAEFLQRDRVPEGMQRGDATQEPVLRLG
jgi:hypothetical protein